MWPSSVRSSTVAAILSLLLVAGGGTAAERRYWPRSPIARGVIIGDRRVPDRDPSAVMWLAARSAAARARTVRFHHGQEMFEATFEAAGLAVDEAATLD